MGNEDASNRSAKNVDTSMSTPLPSRQTQILHVFVQLQRTNSEPAKRCVHDNPESKAIELLASIQSHELAAACLGGFNARLTWKAPKRGGSVVHATMTMSICMGPAMSLLPADDVLAFAQSKSGLVSYTVSLTRTLSLSVCVWLLLCLDLVSRDRQFRAVPPCYK